jgi:hypothetical protein
MDKIFGGSPLGVAFRLIVISIVVGVILSALGWGPLDLVDAIRRLIDWLSRISFDALNSLLRYFLLGAVIVIPLFVLVRVLKLLGGEDKKGPGR